MHPLNTGLFEGANDELIYYLPDTVRDLLQKVKVYIVLDGMSAYGGWDYGNSRLFKYKAYISLSYLTGLDVLDFSFQQV